VETDTDALPWTAGAGGTGTLRPYDGELTPGAMGDVPQPEQWSCQEKCSL